MAEEHHNKSSYEYETAVVDDQQVAVEKTDRGLFNFHRKKEEEKHQEEAIVTEFDEKVTVSGCEPKVDQDQEYEKEKLEKEEKKHGLLEKLHRSNSSSSSSSDEDEGEGEEKKKKKKEKKDKKDKIKDKIAVEKEEEKYEDTNVPVEKYEEEGVVHAAEPVQPEEKKGFLDKIKEKLPGQQKKTEEVPPPPPPSHAEYAAAEPVPSHEGEAKEKKGFLEKIKEKLPGYHPKTEEEKEKEKEKESASHY
ncbi:phosphoprotein ECPP44-like [Juglans microcarpa x Juglans regia]|uniref:phosphoprotein ECPP44-like n=1 Tax=Juglans microcarpa x Juglans regia TaxID=2249226 RepID=UPI001B7F3483|nr:phosphoprotein ECPP44-like [Juglans microcarpa x Juglans regia]